MSEVRTFRAASMQEALDLVRQEMGADAVILHTQQVRRRRFLPWSNPVAHVEVTAGLGINIRPPASPAVAHRQKTRRTAAPQNTRPPAKRPGMTSPPRNNRPAQPATARTAVTAPSSTAKPIAATDGVTFERTTTDAQLARATASLKTSQLQTSQHRPATQLAAIQPAAKTAAGNAGIVSAPATPASPATGVPAEFSHKLNSIQRMLEELGQRRLSPHGEEIPTELFQLYTNLIDAEVEDDMARELIARLKESATPQQLHNVNAALAVLTAMVEKEIPCCGPILPVPGQRKVVALVGSTGVGKTTTIAKLAANFRLRDGVKMGLVTVDTYRIAAVEQLRTYAEIIDLPMRVVTSPPEMRRALEELAGLDLVLIDTAGRSPRDELQIQELKSLLAEACVDEVHLVMNLTASSRTLASTAQKFAAAGTTALIMTKLDEAAGLGALLSVARQVQLPFSYLTTGQDVPDDIEPAHATRMARLILGREKLTS